MVDSQPARPEGGARAVNRKLTKLGWSTLVTETSTNLSVPITIMVLETPITLPELYDILQERLLRQHSRYRSLVQGTGELVELPIEDVVLEQHVRVHQLGDPDSQRELNTVLGNLSCLPLVMTRPLWEVVLIPKFKSGSVLVFRNHHCLSDGGGGAIIVDSISDSPEQWEPKRKPALGEHILQLLALTRPLLASVPFVLYSVILVVLFPDRPSPLKPKQLEGGRRKVAISGPISVPALKKVCRANNCKINDLALTLYAQALRDQAKAIDPTFDKPVWSGIPVDVRLRGEVYTGNKFGFGVCRLPLHIAAFPEALAYVQKRMTFMKEHNLAMVMYYFSVVSSALMPTALLRAMLAFNTRRISLVVSNVAAGNKQLVLKGHAIQYMYALVPPPPNVGIGCSVIGQQDQLVFGMVVDSAAAIDPQAAIDHVLNALHVLSGGEI
eukprot:EG_transcript_7790